MRVAIAALCVLLATTTFTAASNVKTEAQPLPDHAPAHEGREGGETFDTAFPVEAIPFSDVGNTCDNLDDYDEACPWAGTGAPDVVYVYAPASDEDVTIGLCDSSYDTKVYVYDAAGATIGCSDDYCGNDGFKSKIECVTLSSGYTYYIIVDGYGANCGDYSFHMYLCGSPVEQVSWGTVKALYR